MGSLGDLLKLLGQRQRITDELEPVDPEKDISGLIGRALVSIEECLRLSDANRK